MTLLDSVEFDALGTDVSYGRSPNEPSIWQIMGTPTPGQVNSVGFLGAVAAPDFSQARGFYEQAVRLILSTSTEGAVIIYTVDGSAPQGTDQGRILQGNLYTSPISITETGCVRALAFKLGYQTSEIVTHTYLFSEQILAQSDAPEGFSDHWDGTTADYEMNTTLREGHDHHGAAFGRNPFLKLRKSRKSRKWLSPISLVYQRFSRISRLS